jgi:hypothetical protein
MTRHYLRGYVLRADDSQDEGSQDKGGPLQIVAVTEGRKRDGLNLELETGDLARFKANPIVGYGHMYWGRDGLPIGRAERTWIDDGRLMMDITFDSGDDFAQAVERKYRGGFMNAFSIGFDAWNIDDSGTPEGWELFEVSAVPLPMDPDAVVEAGRDQQLALARALGNITYGVNITGGDEFERLIRRMIRRNERDDQDRTAADTEVERLRAEVERLRANEARLRRMAGLARPGRSI